MTQFTSISTRNGEVHIRSKPGSVCREIMTQGGRDNHIASRTTAQTEVKKILQNMDNKCAAFCQHCSIPWTYRERVDLVEVSECKSGGSELGCCKELLTSL